MSNYNVTVTEEAIYDLLEIKSYITFELSNPDAAEKLMLNIQESVYSLEEMPYRNNAVQEERLASQGIRRILIENYIVFYIINENNKEVSVLRVMYNKRAWKDLI